VAQEIAHDLLEQTLPHIAVGRDPSRTSYPLTSEFLIKARKVGARHADDPVVLAVDAAGMVADGHDIETGGTETYTTDRVPPRYLTVRGSADGS